MVVLCFRTPFWRGPGHHGIDPGHLMEHCCLAQHAEVLATKLAVNNVEPSNEEHSLPPLRAEKAISSNSIRNILPYLHERTHKGTEGVPSRNVKCGENRNCDSKGCTKKTKPKMDMAAA